MALRSLNSIDPVRRPSSASKKTSSSSSSMKKSTPFSCPNDENLDLLGGPNRFPPQACTASAIAAACKPLPCSSEVLPPPPPAAAAAAAAVSAEESSPDIEYILSEDLKDLDDADGHLSTLLDRLDSKDWLEACEALNHVRQLAIFHTSSLLQQLDKVVALVIKAMKNPRSALCKTAIMASADLFKAYQVAMLTTLEPLLLQLLLKASQDKRFVCEEAVRSLEGMTTWLSPAPLMRILQPSVAHRNPRVRAKAASCVRRCVSRLGTEGIRAYGFEPLIQIAASQLNDQLPEARESARKLVADLHAAYSHRRPGNDEGMNEESSQEEETWEQFCGRLLSSHVAQAITRLTSGCNVN